MVALAFEKLKQDYCEIDAGLDSILSALPARVTSQDLTLKSKAKHIKVEATSCFSYCETRMRY